MKNPNRTSGTLTAYVIIALGALIMIAPFYFMFTFGTHPRDEIFKMPPPLLPGWAVPMNWGLLMRRVPFPKNFAWSVYVSVLTTGLTLFFSSMAGFAFAMYDFKYKKQLFAVVLGPMMLFGCAYYPYAQLSALGPFQYVFLLNPLTFVSEAMRLAVTPAAAHMPLPLLLGGLAGWLGLFSWLGARTFEALQVAAFGIEHHHADRRHHPRSVESNECAGAARSARRRHRRRQPDGERGEQQRHSEDCAQREPGQPHPEGDPREQSSQADRASTTKPGARS